MVNEHSANDDTSWDTTANLARSVYPGHQDGFDELDWPKYTCYGCGSSFDSEDELITHLGDVHGAA